MTSVAIMGYGTVGCGVAELLVDNADRAEHAVGSPVNLKRILDLREFPGDRFASLLTHRFEDILEDPEIKVVCECMGGTTYAYEYTKRLLAAGKGVVTSNKELVAAHGAELLKLAKESDARYLFEASVGGGIPLLSPMSRDLAVNRFKEVYGILNGTTNYILTSMAESSASFDDCLREAQELGYAERDPSKDVEGFDAMRKICILADLAFGSQVDPAVVPTEGISRMSLRDVKIANRAGYRIKLLGRALRLPEDRRTAYVAPHLIPEDWPIANVESVFNAVVVRGNATGEVMFYGRGAGELPTASACVSDVMECLTSQQPGPLWSRDASGYEDPEELETRHYFRIEGSLTDAALAFGQVEVLSEDGETAFMTDKLSALDAKRQSARLNVLAHMRVLS